MALPTYHSTDRPQRAISHDKNASKRITRGLAAAGYVVAPGILAGRPLARIVRKAGAQW